MAEADPQIDIRAKSSTKSRRFARLALLASVPLLLVGQVLANLIWHSHWWPPLVRSVLGISA